MIAYNNAWLDNKEASEEIDNAFADNSITGEENAAALALYPTNFYTPNIFIRIGLFLLSIVIIGFSFGLLSLLFLTSSNEIESAVATLCILFGIACYAALEWFVQAKNHRQSGVDDALLWMAPGFILTGINFISNIGPLTNAILVLLLAVFLTLRFADRLMAVVASGALLAVVFLAFLRLGDAAKNGLPFVMMLASALIYFVSKKVAILPASKYYRDCLTVTSIAGLVAVYISGNYFVVRETSSEFFNLQSAPGESIPFGWLFWIFTAAIPLFYILMGIIKKDAILLRTGLLLVAAIVFTIRHYYYKMPIETLMIIGGLLMTAVAYVLIKYLKQPKAGFTSEARNNDKASSNIEALIIAETMSGAAPAETGTQFGGGSFGGGGASGEY